MSRIDLDRQSASTALSSSPRGVQIDPVAPTCQMMPLMVSPTWLYGLAYRAAIISTRTAAATRLNQLKAELN